MSSNKNPIRHRFGRRGGFLVIRQRLLPRYIGPSAGMVMRGRMGAKCAARGCAGGIRYNPRHVRSSGCPTGTPTPPPTAPLDLPHAEQLFAQAQQQFSDKNWTGMIQTLILLRVDSPDFQPFRVDGLLFIALRNQGVALIDQGKLEEGLYYLDLAKNYAPLDNHASQRADWAQLLLNLYQAANVYFETDWEKAVETFGQVYAMAPFFRDTPIKYPAALFGYGEQFMQEGKPCDAVAQFQAAANLQPSNPDYSDDLGRANRDCAASRPTAVPSATPGGETPTPSPTP